AMPHLNDWYIRCWFAFSVSDFSSFSVSGEECAATSLLTVSRSMPQLRQNLCSRVVSAPQLGQCIQVSKFRDYLTIRRLARKVLWLSANAQSIRPCVHKLCASRARRSDCIRESLPTSPPGKARTLCF